MTLHANGKLLLTAEYFVLDGAKALALPTKLGQTINCYKNIEINTPYIFWNSDAPNSDMWYRGVFNINDFLALDYEGEADLSKGLTKIFKAIHELNPLFWAKNINTTMNARLEFPSNWGLGSSSTLIWLLAKWAKIDPFVLNDKTFGGSGYDIACAGAQKPIFFERKNKEAIFTEVDFKPSFSDQLYFVFLNQKQNSREGIARYREKAKNLPPQYFDDIWALTNAFFTATTLSDFEKHIVEHERLVASVIDLPRAKSLYFKDFWGEIKSLGAWGGDFVLVTSDRSLEETKQYFAERGFDTILKYDDLII